MLKKLLVFSVLLFLSSVCNAQELRIKRNALGGENFYLRGKLVLQTKPNYFGGQTYIQNGKRIGQSYQFNNQTKFNQTPYFLRNAKSNSSNTRKN